MDGEDGESGVMGRRRSGSLEAAESNAEEGKTRKWAGKVAKRRGQSHPIYHNKTNNTK